jgi:hypothetical protein
MTDPRTFSVDIAPDDAPKTFNIDADGSATETRDERDTRTDAALEARLARLEAERDALAARSQVQHTANEWANEYQNLRQRHTALERAKYDADADKLTDLAAEQAKITIRMAAVENAYNDLRQQPADPTVQRQQWLSGQSAANRQWIEAHPKFFEDAQFQKAAIAAASYATDVVGVDPSKNPDAYHRILDDVLRTKLTTSTASQTISRESDPSFSDDDGKPIIGAIDGGKVHLSRAEREAAKFLFADQIQAAERKGETFDSDLAYARNKRALARDAARGVTQYGNREGGGR